GKDLHEFPEPFTGVTLDVESKTLMELNAVLLKACAPDPKLRYKTAAEMNADLALLHSGQSVRDKHALERRLKLMTHIGIAAAASEINLQSRLICEIQSAVSTETWASMNGLKSFCAKRWLWNGNCIQRGIGP